LLDDATQKVWTRKALQGDQQLLGLFGEYGSAERTAIINDDKEFVSIATMVLAE